MLTPTAQSAATVRLVGTSPTVTCYMLQEGEIDRGRNWAQLWMRMPGWPIDVKQLSDNRPESLIRSPSHITAPGPSAPSQCYAEELLDWDAFIKVPPSRPSGTLVVSLEYGGTGKPTPLPDPWD